MPGSTIPVASTPTAAPVVASPPQPVQTVAVGTNLPPTTMVTSNTGNVTAMSVIIIVNWLLSHLATSWVLPPEVAGAGQALLVWGVSEWSVARRNKQAVVAAAAQPVAVPVAEAKT